MTPAVLARRRGFDSQGGVSLHRLDDGIVPVEQALKRLRPSRRSVAGAIKNVGCEPLLNIKYVEPISDAGVLGQANRQPHPAARG